MIQSVGEPGEIRVQVSAKGLICDSLLCHSEEAPAGTPGMSNLPCGVKGTENMPVRTGKADEIPVRKITLLTEEDRVFGPGKKRMSVEARIDPPEADDRELFFRAVDDHGVDSNLVRLVQDGNRAQLEALGDGAFRLRCMSKSGTDAIRLISQLEFEIH